MGVRTSHRLLGVLLSTSVSQKERLHTAGAPVTCSGGQGGLHPWSQNNDQFTQEGARNPAWSPSAHAGRPGTPLHPLALVASGLTPIGPTGL